MESFFIKSVIFGVHHTHGLHLEEGKRENRGQIHRFNFFLVVLLHPFRFSISESFLIKANFVPKYC